MKIGIIKEGKAPSDSRVALTPKQCRWVMENKGFHVSVQSSPNRCFSDEEYIKEGILVTDSVADCNLLLGIKEVPVNQLIPDKTYFFFSHTHKLQPYNQNLIRAIIDKKITLVDYECLEHEDGARVIGFGYFAGVVGAHNGMMAYGHRTSAFHLDRVYKQESYQDLIHTYFGLKLPPVKIVVTGSGRVSHGLLEVMSMMEVIEVEPDEFKEQDFNYPAFIHLKGKDLYLNRKTGKYNRQDFRDHPEEYDCLFREYFSATDILLNGIFWNERIPRLFEMEDLQSPDFRIQTIADITDDMHGSVPCNLGDSTIDDPVYGVDKITGKKTAPYLDNSIDIMAVGNLPNELARDASRFFGEQLIKYILDSPGAPTDMVSRATIVKEGTLTARYKYMEEFAGV